MKLIIRENIYVVGPDQNLRRKLLGLAIFRRRGSRGGLVRFFRQTMWGVALPRGLMSNVKALLSDTTQVLDLRFTGPTVDYAWQGKLRPEQSHAAWQVHAAEGGILSAWPGAGKTNVAMAAVAAWRQPCLWLVHTAALAHQAMSRARDLYNLPPKAYGMVGDGECTWGTHITVALVQTLAQRKYLEEAGIGTVVVDECHHAPAMTVARVLSRLAGRYRLGVTATPERSDGLGRLMVALFGGVVEITPATLMEYGRVILPGVEIIPTTFSLVGPVEWAKLVQLRASARERNSLIVRLIAQETHLGHRVLVLTDLVAHALYLAEVLSRMGIPANAVVGATGSSDRAKFFRAGAVGSAVLVATKLADEGLDLPALDRLVLAMPGKSVSRLTQQIGRIVRTWAGKKDAVVYDVADVCVPALVAQLRSRIQTYQSMGLQVTRHGRNSVV